MAKITLKLSRLKPEEVVQLGTTINTAMTGNANFATPVPPLATLAAGVAAAQTAIANYENTAALLRERLLERDAAIDSLKGLIRQEASYVVGITDGDAVKILSAGMNLAAHAPAVVAMPQVQDLAATSGANDGEVDLRWKKIRNAHSYEIQISASPITATSWGSSVTCTRASYRMEGLTSGARLWFRVRAIGGRSMPGAWSDPATKTVP
jgi:hypothetical protein